MTPEDLSLDNPPFAFLSRKKTSIRLYRLARARYANLSGVGAAKYPGRWNAAGTEAIYTSTEKSLTVLERLVHTPKDQIPSNLALMTIRLTGQLVRIGLEDEVENETGAFFCTFSTLAAAKARFTASHFLGAVAVALPSVVAPTWNVILFPEVLQFWKLVELESVETFDYDPRLFPENTPTTVNFENTPTTVRAAE